MPIMPDDIDAIAQAAAPVEPAKKRLELSLWARRALIALSALPSAVLLVLHAVGRAEKYEGGLLGEWWVRLTVTLLAVAGIGLVAWVRSRTTVRGTDAAGH